MNEPRFDLVSSVCARRGWPAPEVVASTGSTNDDLVGRSGHGRVLIAVEQTAGQGRLGRPWVSTHGRSLTFSVRLEVPPTVTAWGWIPLLAGVATAQAIRDCGATGIGLKWPNDLVAGPKKIAGILSVRDGAAGIVGIGVNLEFSGAPPYPHAGSVAEQGGRAQADALLAGIVEGLARRWDGFVAAGGDAVRSGLQEAYVALCVSLQVPVEVRAGERTWTGFAEGIDDQGHLLVREGQDLRVVTAADVSVRHH